MLFLSRLKFSSFFSCRANQDSHPFPINRSQICNELRWFIARCQVLEKLGTSEGFDMQPSEELTQIPNLTWNRAGIHLAWNYSKQFCKLLPSENTQLSSESINYSRKCWWLMAQGYLQIKIVTFGFSKGNSGLSVVGFLLEHRHFGCCLDCLSWIFFSLIFFFW